MMSPGRSMDLYLVIHTVLMHVSAALIILIYVPLSIPVKLFMRALVKPWRKEDLRGKVVLITGASSGIGEEFAYQYARQGARLALVARRKQALDGVAAAARERGSPDVLVLTADVSDPEQSRLAVEETVAHFGKLNHLVANAGVWTICRFDEVTNITAFTKTMDVNFWGSVYPTYYALPHLKASKGKLIVTSSIAGTMAVARTSFYNATKAAQLRFYETLRAELGSEVGVTILTPGFIESEITKGKAIHKGGELAVDEEARDEIPVETIAGADRGVPGGPRGDALRGSTGRRQERRPVRDVAVHVLAAASGGAPRPRDLRLAVQRPVQHRRGGGRPPAQPAHARAHRSQEAVPAVAPGSHGGGYQAAAGGGEEWPPPHWRRVGECLALVVSDVKKREEAYLYMMRRVKKMQG